MVMPNRGLDQDVVVIVIDGRDGARPVSNTEGDRLTPEPGIDSSGTSSGH
jgi:hypothetical protein